VTTPQHDDPFGEASGKVLQALAVLTTVGESAARFAASGAQNRAAKAERKANAERVADAARQQADRAAARAHAVQERADRQFMDKAFDKDWLANADIHETATLWRTAAMYSMSGDKRATEARHRAQERLRDLNPGLMDAFARHRAAGMNLADAMRAAAHDVWQHQTRTDTTSSARPHGNTGDPARSLGPSRRGVGAAPDPDGLHMVDELEAATRAEVARLAERVDPELLDGLQRQWRSAGHAPAADAAALLANAARQLRAESQLTDPATTTTTLGHGANHPPEPNVGPRLPITHDTVDVPVRTNLAGLEIAAQGLDRAAEAVRAGQAAEQHLTGLADQQQRAGAVDSGVPDLPSTPANEHQDAMASSRLHRGGGEHDRAGADQQQRLGRAFPPLRTVTPPFSAAPIATNPSTTQRKGRTR
jgi:hypothetical protein